MDRYQVFTPFLFDDGDHLVIVLKRNNSHWVLSDEGHTYMHLTYRTGREGSPTRDKAEDYYQCFGHVRSQRPWW